MISMCCLQLHRRSKRQERDVARLLDGIAQPVLVRSADARNAPGHDFAALGDKAAQHPHIFVVDIVDLLDAEAATLLPPEILLLLCGNRLVTAGGPLRRAAWSSSAFRHVVLLYSAALSPSICCATE